MLRRARGRQRHHANIDRNLLPPVPAVRVRPWFVNQTLDGPHGWGASEHHAGEEEKRRARQTSIGRSSEGHSVSLVTPEKIRRHENASAIL